MTDKLDRLMDYLYGEMVEAERRGFEEELARDPELRAELAALRESRGMLGALPDAQPEAGVRAMPARRIIRAKWPLRAGMAAAFLLLLYLFGARLEVGPRGVVFALGTPPPETEKVITGDGALAGFQQALKERDLRLERQLQEMDSLWMQRLSARERHLQQTWAQQLAGRPALREEEMDALIRQFREAELPELAGLIQNLQLQQQQELRLLLADFWNHWQQTRAADLESIESEFVNLYQNVELKPVLEVEND